MRFLDGRIASNGIADSSVVILDFVRTFGWPRYLFFKPAREICALLAYALVMSTHHNAAEQCFLACFEVRDCSIPEDLADEG